MEKETFDILMYFGLLFMLVLLAWSLEVGIEQPAALITSALIIIGLILLYGLDKIATNIKKLQKTKVKKKAIPRKRKK